MSEISLDRRPQGRLIELEVTLRSMVAKLLLTDAERVDPNAPLLELGADSLVLAEAIEEIEGTFGVTITIRQLFEELTTLHNIALYLDRQLPPEENSP